MKHTLLFWFVTILLGCTDTGVKPTEKMILDLPEEFVEVPSQPIDKEIVYSFVSHTGSGKVEFALQILTKQYFPHTGYRIISTIRRTDYRFAVSLEKIQAEAGRTIAAPASKVFTLGHLPNGAYSFDIHINGKTVRMAILVRGQNVESCIQPNNFISERVWLPD